MISPSGALSRRGYSLTVRQASWNPDPISDQNRWGVGVLLGILGGGQCHPVLQILTQFQTKNAIFHTRFSTRSLTFTTVFTPGLWAEIVLSLLGLEWKQKNSSKPFQIRIFLSLSYSFGLKKKIRSYIPELLSKTILDSRLKWAKCIPVFRPKRRKNPTRWDGTYLYKGVPPTRDQNMWFFFSTLFPNWFAVLKWKQNITLLETLTPKI